VRIGLLGTRGVPAHYGGFETAAEEIGARLVARGHEVVVYCRNRGQNIGEYRGMRLVNLPAPRRRSIETLGHTFVSALHASRANLDCAVLFNAANAPLLPLLRMPVAVHVDGLEWKRGKWAGHGQRYLRWAERHAVTHADRVIADARAIQDHLRVSYGVEAVFVPYGAPIVDRKLPPQMLPGRVTPGRYHLVVARFEPENNVDLILRSYFESGAANPLLLIGDVPYASEYRRVCRDLADSSESILDVGSVWDQDVLDACYANCSSYIHGHSVGGTNPSLLRAMGAGACVLAFDVVFNRVVAGPDARYFADQDDLAAHIRGVELEPRSAERQGNALQERASDLYRWDEVAEAYEQLCASLSGREAT